MPAPESRSPGRLPRPLQWALLLALSAVFAGGLEFAALPAAFLIGPMLAGIAAGASGATIRVPGLPFAGAQALIGVLVAASIEPDILGAFAGDWPAFAGVVLATVAASSLLGWLISRWRILPGTTAVWGSAPGAATAMVLMAGAFGADQRLVAFMQYLRVIFVTVAAALIARLFVDIPVVARPETEWFPALDWSAFLATLAAAAAGAVAGRLVRLPSPYFLGTLILAVALHLAGGVEFQLPEWLLALSYAVVGWSIGLGFDRTVLAHARRALPQIVLSVVALMLFCGGLAALLVGFMDIDPLTAYLATSPGGMDTIAIIAAASNSVNLSFVLALQSARFLFVLIAGPAITRLVARGLR